MVIKIGARTDSDFSDPIGLPEDCHRRIEKFLSVLQTSSVHLNYPGRLIPCRSHPSQYPFLYVELPQTMMPKLHT